MILISKNENKPINLHLINPTLIQKKDNKLYNIYSLIGKWGLHKTQESFYDFIKDNKIVSLFIAVQLLTALRADSLNAVFLRIILSLLLYVYV